MGPRQVRYSASGMDSARARAFVVEIGAALHRFGTPSHRLESALTGISHQLGMRAQIFTTPTQLVAAFGPSSEQSVSVLRIEPGEIDLEKLAALDGLADEVVAGALDIEAGLAEVERITNAARRYPGWMVVLAFAAASAAVARFFGGGINEMATSGGIGLVIGILSLVLVRTTSGVRLFEMAAAFVASAAALGVAHVGAPVSVRVAIVASLIVLIPGLTLTVALTELATRNLVSGTARLTAAIMVFLEIAFGVALADTVMTRIFGSAVDVAAVALPLWTEPVSLVVAAAAIAVLFQTHPRSIATVMIACSAAFYGARLGAYLLGPELGAGVGALILGMAANGYARIAKRPAMVPLVPGILLLVPGSLGFRSLSAMMERDVITGIEIAFAMVVVATSLVAGLLMANAAVSPRRDL